MNLRLTLLKRLALLTLISGVCLPPNIAKAASSDPTNRAFTQPENLGNQESIGEYHETGSSSILLLSYKAQKIGFFTFLILSSCSLSLVATKFFCKARGTEEKPREEIDSSEPKNGSSKVVPENLMRLTLVADNRQEFKNEGEEIKLDQSEQERKAA